MFKVGDFVSIDRDLGVGIVVGVDGVSFLVFTGQNVVQVGLSSLKSPSNLALVRWHLLRLGVWVNPFPVEGRIVVGRGEGRVEILGDLTIMDSGGREYTGGNVRSVIAFVLDMELFDSEGGSSYV